MKPMGNHPSFDQRRQRKHFSRDERISVSYATYYNWKYKTSGHLFQDRFKSENVESVDYLLTVTRYIHQEPVKTDIVMKVALEF
jgi:putative transposase